MYDLSLHIEYLLLGHDCVVLPGFGAFINVRHSAAFDSDKSIWTPPVREIRFNKALNHDDGLLSNSYSRKNEVSFQEGRRLMRRDLDQLERSLAEEGEVTLGNLGILRKNNEVLIFEPLASAFRLTRILGYHDASISSNVEEPVENSAMTLVAKEAPAHPEATKRIFNTERNYYLPINKIFARSVACLMILAVVALAVVIPCSDKFRADQASVVPVQRIFEVTSQPVSVEKADEGDTEKASVNSANIGIVDIEKVHGTQPSTSSIVADAGKYHAIVATFNSMAEAESYVERYRGQNETLHVIDSPTKKRVSAFDSSDREEVRQKIKDPDFKEKYGQAWIWEK